MKSARQVERIVGHARLPADQAADARILSDAGAALAQFTHNRPQALLPGPTLWRTIMESKATKYSVAATILVATSLVLLNPFSGSRHGVVLGEVAQKLNETRTVMHKEKRLAWRPGEDKPFFEGEARKYISTDIGFMEEQYDPNGAVEHRFYLLKEGQIVLVFPPSKRYIKLPARGRIYEELLRMTTPTGMVNYFTAMPHTKLGRSHFGDFEAEGFEVSHVDFSLVQDYIKYLFPIRNLSARLWVDAETSLPVTIEMKMDADRGLLNGFQKVHAEFTAYDFQWNAELPVGILDPNIPPDYTQIGLGSIAQENAAWLGVGGVPLGLLVYRGCRRRRGRLHIRAKSR
jgi:hypothetical protein